MTTPDFESALLRGLLVAEGFDDAFLETYFADLADPSKSFNRWQQMVRSGAPKAKAKTMRATWKSAGATLRRMNKYGDRLGPLDGPMVLQLIGRNYATPKKIGRAMKLAAAIATEGRRVGIAQLLIDEGSLTHLEFVACVEAAGQRLLHCRDCVRYHWLPATSDAGEPICDECHTQLRPPKGEIGPDCAVPAGFDSLDHARPAIERDGVSYGKALVDDVTGALYEAIDTPGMLLKRVRLPTHIWKPEDSAQAADTSLKRDALRSFRRHLGEARRIEDPHIAAPARLLIDDDGGWLPFEVPAGHIVDPEEGHPTPGSPTALRVARDVLRGLTSLHRQGMVHGAVRSSVVWLTEEGRAKLLVTGEHLQPGLDEPADPAYRPPHAADDPTIADVGTDIHGACALLLALHGLEPDADPTGPLDGLPEGIADSVRRGLSPSEDEELPTIGALLAELSTMLPGEDAARRAGSRRQRPSSAANDGRARNQTSRTSTGPIPIANRKPMIVAVVFGIIAIAAGVAVALHHMPPDGGGSPVIETTRGDTGGTDAERTPISEDDRESFGMLLARGKASSARELLERMTPARAQRAELINEVLPGLNARTILELSQDDGWPLLATSLKPVLAGAAFKRSLLAEARRDLEEGNPSDARPLLAAAHPDAAELATALAEHVDGMSLDRLVQLRTTDWPELKALVGKRLARDETKQAFVVQVSELLGRRDYDEARKTLKMALGLERLQASHWEKALVRLDSDRLVAMFRETAPRRNQRAIARAAARALHKVDAAEAKALGELITKESREYLKDERYRAAIASCSTLLMLMPEDHQTFCRRGICQRELGQNDLAIKDFTRAIELEDDFLFGFNGRQITYTTMGEYDKALADIASALKLADPGKPTWGSLMAARITVRILQSKIADARPDIATLRTKLTPVAATSASAKRALEHLSALEALGMAVEGKKDEARKVLDPLLTKHLGSLLAQRSGIARRANIKLGRILVALMPDDPRAHAELAIWQFSYRKVDAGSASLEKAIGLSKEGTRTRRVLDALKARVAKMRSKLSGEHDTAPDGDW